MSNEKNVVTTHNQGENVPDHLRSKSGATGTEGMGADDVSVPRIKICQALSRAKDTLENLKDGDFYHSSDGVLGKEIEVFVLAYWKSTIWFRNSKLVGVEMANPSNKVEMIRYGSDIETIMSSEEIYLRGEDAKDGYK